MVYTPPKDFDLRFKGACDKNKPRKDKEGKIKRNIAVGVNIEQRLWQPTIRTRRIAAEFIPGAPAYKPLPPLLGPNIIDSRKKSLPAYTMRVTTYLRYQNFLEGPAKYNLAGVTKNGGIQKSPAYTMMRRPRELTKFVGPGPNRYNIHKSYGASTQTILSYSFGKKPKTLSKFPNPAANVYYLPPILGTSKEGKFIAAPQFSLLGRVKPRQIPAFILPGPGQYEDNTKNLAKSYPKYTIRRKHKVITDENMKPGPAAHCPEKYMKHKSVPAPSFSIRHTDYKAVQRAHLMPECTDMPLK